MQRSAPRKAQALLPHDKDDDGSKNKSPTLVVSQKQLGGFFFLGALFLGTTFFFSVTSGFNPSKTSQLLNTQVTLVESKNKGLKNKGLLLRDQIMAALQSESEELQSENERLRQNLESLQQQSNVRRREDKPAAVAAAVTPIRRSIPATVAVAAPAATATNKVAVVSASAPLKPIACQELIDEVKKSGAYRDRKVIDPNLKHGSFTRQTITEHPFWISVHNKEFDKTRWTIHKKGRYYEFALGKIWTNILREASPGSRVLDVGYVAFLQLCLSFVLLLPTPSHLPQVLCLFELLA
jgi:hypothetical protein